MQTSQPALVGAVPTNWGVIQLAPARRRGSERLRPELSSPTRQTTINQTHMITAASKKHSTNERNYYGGAPWRSGGESDARPEGRAVESRPIRDVRLSSIVFLSSIVNYYGERRGAVVASRTLDPRVVRSNPGQSVTCACLPGKRLPLIARVFSGRTLKIVGPFYLVSMPGEVKDPTLVM